MKELSAKQQWKWRLSKNERNKRTAETLISKYGIRWFKSHLPGAVSIYVAVDVDITVDGYIYFCAVDALIFFKEAPNKNETEG